MNFSAVRRRMGSIVPYLPLLFPALLLFPGLSSFPFPPFEGAYSDIAVSHYPNALFLKRALVEYQSIPLWSPSILGGFPFAANPLSSLWYPPAWFALLFPLPLGFNIVVIAHLCLGGVGMYRLLRAEGLQYHAALLGGLAFESMPKLFAHYGAGHLTLLYAVPWTPWLLLLSHQMIAPRRTSIGNQSRQAVDAGPTNLGILLPALMLALMIYADIRWAVYGWAAWVAYSFARREARSPLVPTFCRLGLQIISSTFVAALLAAPLLLPLLEYTRLSTRSSLSPLEVFEFSLPPTQLLGLVFPQTPGFYEWVRYPGAVIFCLSLTALFLPGRRKGGGYWILLLSAALLYSLGDSLPFLPVLARLPGLNLLRVPARALFLAGMAFAALSAYTVNILVCAVDLSARRAPRLVLVGLAAFCLMLAGGEYALSGSLSFSLAWGACLSLAGAVWIFARLAERLPARLWWAGLVGVCLLDWSVVNLAQFQSVSPQLVLSESGATASWIATQEGLFRSYSPSYSLQQQTAAKYNLELAEGVDPLQIRAYAQFMEQASGVPVQGYSVTLPAFLNGNPSVDNARSQPDAKALGRLNVRFLAAEYDLLSDGLSPRARFGETRIYENLLARPRAWIESADQAGLWLPAQVLDWRPNRITVHALGPGTLVLAENMYPGWTARIDGVRAPVGTVEGVLRAVELGPGEHSVTFSFKPASLYAGLTLAAAAWAMILLSVGRIAIPACRSHKKTTGSKETVERLAEQAVYSIHLGEK